MALPQPFAYPIKPHIRKHGPLGYQDYESYREWLRDEFTFRCVFCLKREQWDILDANWSLDHFMPQSIYPGKILEYSNLLYACRSCNSAKSAQIVPNPSLVSFGDCVRVNNDGTITALTPDGENLIRALRLDSPRRNRYRSMIIGTIQSLAQHNMSLFTEWMRYPDNLPNLSTLRCKGNTRPEGVKDSYHEQRKRGKLPEIY